MTVHHKKLMRTAAKTSVLALMAAGLGAWDLSSDLRSHRIRNARCGRFDHVNKATQTIDPWPPYVKNRKLDLAGPRAGLAMDRYQTNRALAPRPLNAEKPAEVPADVTLQAPAPQQQ